MAPQSSTALTASATPQVNSVTMSATQDQHLSPPFPTDTGGIVSEKMICLADVAARGESVAMGIGADNCALLFLTPLEAELYHAWKRGAITVPPFNWVFNFGRTPPLLDGKDVIYERCKLFSLAEAMRLLWCTRKADVHHVVWLISEESPLLPLLEAMGKILRKRELYEMVFKMPSLMNDLEIKVIRLINKQAASVMEKPYGASLGQESREKKARMVLQGRENALKTKADAENIRGPH